MACLSACTGQIFEPSGGADAPGEGAGGPGEGPGAVGGDGDPYGPGGSGDMLADEGTPLGPELRLMHADEYRAAVRDLLGVEASPTLSFADAPEGYPTGADNQLDEGLLITLLAEGERVAESWMDTRASDDFPCAADPDAACADELIASLAPRAYRRPLTGPEEDELAALYAALEGETGDARVALQAVVTRLLTAVHFLHRIELGAPDGDARLLSSHEQASLIAFATTGAPPDEALRAAAAAGLDEDARRAHALRLLRSEAGRARMSEFLRAYLQADDLTEMARHPDRFPKLDEDPGLGADLEAELDAVVRDVLYEREGSFATLLTTEETFLTERTAPLYDLPSPATDLEPTRLESTRRKGVLSLASVMAAHGAAAGDRDRPVVRGLMIKERFFCEEIGLPSGIDTGAAFESAGITAEERERLPTRVLQERIMNQGPVCLSCHEQFVPLGFAFGQFDALGRERTHWEGTPIDSSVDRVVLAGESWSLDDHLALIDLIAESEVAARCFLRNYLVYLSGQARPPLSLLPAERDLRTAPLIELLADLFASPDLYRRAQE